MEPVEARSEGGPDPSASEDEESPAGPQLQVIGLQLAQERFIIDILNVSEIVRLGELTATRVPHAHDYVIGVANLRGKVVPVVDMAVRLGLPSTPKTAEARMIVVEMGDSGVGFTVDSVSAVLSLTQDALVASTSGEDYVLGTTTLNGQILTMLDLEALLSGSTQAQGARTGAE